MLEKLKLDGRVAIVTGGSRGLGKAMSTALAQAGAGVCIASRTPSQLESAAAEIEQASARAPLIVPTDVQDRAACDGLIEKTLEHFGRLDIMMNNAGIGDARGAGARFWELDDADWHDSIEVNLYSTFYCSRAAVRVLLKQQQGA
jgi:NAD(P)-dependent dehydrogenase (short-subunit alcohol dehydrogenase family)